MGSTTLRWTLFAAAGLMALLLGVINFVDLRVEGLWINTAYLAVGSCLIAVPLGTLAAVIIFKTDAPGRRMAALLLAAMLLIPLFLIAGAWDAGFGVQGWHTLFTNPHGHSPWLAGWRAAIWIHALAAVPWVTLIVAAGLRAVETELEEDASLCASPLRVLWHVTLPRAAPSIAIAAVWVAIIASVEISVTDFFQVRTFAEEVYTQAALGTFDFSSDSTSSSFGALGMWLGISLSTLLALVALLAARRLLVDLANASLRQSWRWRLGRGRWPAALLLGFILLLVAGVPLATLVYKAGGQAIQTETGRERSWSAAKAITRIAAAPVEFGGDLWLTARLGAAAATGAALFGLPLAWSLRLARRAPLVRLFGLALCFTIPGPLLGISVIRLLNQPPGSPLAFLAPLYDSYFAAWLVQTIRALPLVTLVLWSALASVSRSTLDAAALDGAGWWRRLLQVALPQRRPALAAAWLVGFAIASGELAATVLVLPPDRSTAITVRVFQLLHYGVDDRVAAISLLLAIGVALITLLASAFVGEKNS
jgi:iron(III) transport system permease protein